MIEALAWGMDNPSKILYMHEECYHFEYHNTLIYDRDGVIPDVMQIEIDGHKVTVIQQDGNQPDILHISPAAGWTVGVEPDYKAIEEGKSGEIKVCQFIGV